MTEVVRYIIVVHGMGESRPNETMLPVITRFAEHRNGQSGSGIASMLTLGAVSSQVGACSPIDSSISSIPWVEFKGIPSRGPQDPGQQSKQPVHRTAAALQAGFDGSRDRSGKNFRFAEIWWKPAQDEDANSVLQGPREWASGIIGRLDFQEALDEKLAQLKKKKQEGEATDAKLTSAAVAASQKEVWVKEVMAGIRDLVAVLHVGLCWRAKGVSDLVFNRFLGDVQMYGDYLPLRGRAVRRFHEMMTLIHQQHDQQERTQGTNREACYTIIAHSLGTVMALDALTYAHVQKDLRASAGHDTLFPGYLRANEMGSVGTSSKTDHMDFLDTSWVRNVGAFVTLGSPIDKFLTLWRDNYSYLNDVSLLDTEMQAHRSEKKIRHLNYCEEQDPVGHHLDALRDRSVYSQIFSSQFNEDTVYGRSAVPGGAHVAYWTDPVLFKDILDRVFDGKQPQSRNPLVWFSPLVFFKVTVITYLLVPILIIAWLGTSLWYSIHGEVVGTRAIAGASVVVSVWCGRRLIDLMVWWRQIGKIKNGSAAAVGDARFQTIRNTYSWLFWIVYGTCLVILGVGISILAGNEPLRSHPVWEQIAWRDWHALVPLVVGSATATALAFLQPLTWSAFRSQRLWRPLLIAAGSIGVVVGAAYGGLSKITSIFPAPAAWPLSPVDGLVMLFAAWMVLTYQFERIHFIKDHLKNPHPKT